jgi:hypothetical protein
VREVLGAAIGDSPDDLGEILLANAPLRALDQLGDRFAPLLDFWLQFPASRCHHRPNDTRPVCAVDNLERGTVHPRNELVGRNHNPAGARKLAERDRPAPRQLMDCAPTAPRDLRGLGDREIPRKGRRPPVVCILHLDPLWVCRGATHDLCREASRASLMKAVPVWTTRKTMVSPPFHSVTNHRSGRGAELTLLSRFSHEPSPRNAVPLSRGGRSDDNTICEPASYGELKVWKNSSWIRSLCSKN